MGGIEFDEAIRGRNSRVWLVIFIVGVGHIELRLCGVLTKGIASLQFLVELGGFFKTLFIQLVTRFLVELFCGPVRMFVLRFIWRIRTTPEQEAQGHKNPYPRHKRAVYAHERPIIQGVGHIVSV